tara:strand:- start:1 stop:108 length:108 start_codon:yes stop_codon:yes gene_type:complete
LFLTVVFKIAVFQGYCFSKLPFFKTVAVYDDLIWQ